TGLDHAPVGAVAVHGGDHAPAAGGEPNVDGRMLGELGLGALDVELGGRIGDVAAVEESVDPDLLDLIFVRLAQDLEQVADVGVDVAVRQEPDQVERSATTSAGVHDIPPRIGLPDLTGRDRVVDALRTLIEDPTCSEDVVTDFGVAH